ncbi:MAG: MBL fold metallo-hydrolase [Thermodesulfobacteriota bacterium]|nr:MBL fold metallo-hydrolase [Thermodesulfobacteriota bacterium]
MQIEILGAESLGVRGLCCLVTTKHRNILIDPGTALGYMREKLLPHPVQIAVDEKVQQKVIRAWGNATDIVISHFHGDHVPLADANPYQLDIKRLIGLNEKRNIWTKDPCHFSPTETQRAKHLSSLLQTDLIPAEGKKKGCMSFSEAAPHGKANDRMETVMMTRIEEDQVFVHASDIQLLDDETVSYILAWKPDILLVGGPAIYLSRLSNGLINRAWKNAVRLSEAIDMVILDHHLMRSHEGLDWIARLNTGSGKAVMCAADFMHTPRMLLEADRRELYEKMPVPVGWHEDYAAGKSSTDDFWRSAKSSSIVAN